MQPLRPTFTLDRLHPPRTVWAPRTEYELGRWVFMAPFRVDALTGLTLTVAGTMPMICHHQTVTPVAAEFFAQSGIALPPTVVGDHRPTVYDTADEAYEIAGGFAADGYRLAGPYPVPDERDLERALLVPTALYNWLNDKTNLAELVDPGLLAPAVTCDPGDTSSVLSAFAGEAVFVKACIAGASGSGFDVRFCAGAPEREVAAAWLAGRGGEIHTVRIERALDIVTCWCLNLAVLDDRVVYLGAAIQLFEAPGVQSGSLIDPDLTPPEAVVDISVAIAEEGRRRGYRGIVGFDIGTTITGEPYVFDLNFRMAASTPQVLLHDAAVARTGTRISESWDATVDGPLGPALERLAGHGASGRLVPTRLWEATADSNHQSVLNGLLVGSSTDEIDETAHEIATLLADLRRGH